MRSLPALLSLLTVGAHAQTLEESSRSIGGGFREVMRSEALPAGSFESIGHITFVYFEDRKLCECSARDLFVSPSGSFAVFIDGPSGQVKLFAIQSKRSTPITSSFVALVDTVSWDEKSRSATVRFRHSETGNTTPHPLAISLPVMPPHKSPAGMVVFASKAPLVRQIALKRKLPYEELAVPGHDDAVRFRFSPMSDEQSRGLAFAIPREAYYFQGVILVDKP
jgi:hypothetical protein